MAITQFVLPCHTVIYKTVWNSARVGRKTRWIMHDDAAEFELLFKRLFNGIIQVRQGTEPLNMSSFVRLIYEEQFLTSG